MFYQLNRLLIFLGIANIQPCSVQRESDNLVSIGNGLFQEVGGVENLIFRNQFEKISFYQIDTVL